MNRSTKTYMPNANKKLKIAFVIDDSLDRGDGVQQYVLTLGSWLGADGHDVHYICSNTQRSDIANIHSIARNIRVKFNGNWLAIPLPGFNDSKIKELLSSHKFDVIHIQTPYSPFFGARVIKLAPKNTVVIGTFHILPYGPVSNFGNRLLAILLRNTNKLVDEFVSVSVPAKEFAEEYYNINSSVVPNMVDMKKFNFKNKVSSDKFRLVFLGRLVERKGCGYLLKALDKLKNDYPDIEFELIICGKGPMMQSLQDFTNNRSIKNNVRFVGFVSEEEKVKYLASAALAVFPSYSGESFGIVLLEAMAADAGVVLYGHNPGYDSVMSSVPEAGFDARDTVEFTDKLYQFMTDEKLRSEIHNKQKELVKQFSLEVIGPKIVGIYNANCKIAENR